MDRRFLVIFFLTGLTLLGCQKSGTDGKAEAKPTIKPRDVAIDPYKINPFSIYSQQARALKHPPGIDTVAYWGTGRFSVVMNTVYDAESNTRGTGIHPVFTDLLAMRQESALVYFASNDEYLILDLATGNWNRFKKNGFIPTKYAEPLKWLQDPSDAANLIWKPGTLWPIGSKRGIVRKHGASLN